MSAKLSFSEALKLDLAHREMSEAGLGKALGISQQAVHKWIDRGFPPLSRVGDLRDLLGESSNFAKLTHEDLFGDGQTSRTPNPARAAALYKYQVLVEGYTPPPLSPAQAFAKAEGAEFVKHLHPSLFVNLERHTATGTLDYASDKLAVEVAYVQGVVLSLNSSRAILELMMYRDTVVPTARVMLAWVGTPEGRRIPQSALIAAKTYKVESVQVSSGRELAELINDIELGGELLEPDDE